MFKCVTQLKATLPPNVLDIIFWENPQRSGLLLGLATMVYFLLSFRDFTVLTLGSYLLFSLVLAAFAYLKLAAVRGQSYNDTAQFRNTIDCLSISEDQIHSTVSVVYKYYRVAEEHFLTTLKESDSNYVSTAKLVAVLLLCGQIGNFFSFLTIVWGTIFWLFTWPAVYTKHQATIDSKYNELHSKLMVKLDPLLQKIPGYGQDASVEKKNQ